MELGHPWEIDHPVVAEAIDHILDACNRAGILPGIVTSTAEEASRRVKQGFKIVTVMNDLGFFKAQSKRYLKEIRGS